MSYNVEWRPVGGATTSVTGITDLFYDLTGLTAAEDYEFRVQEDDGTNVSGWSDWTGFTTAADSTPQDTVVIQLQQLTHTQVTPVSQQALLTGIIADQTTNSESGAVAADFDIQLSEAEQITNSESGAVAADFDIQLSEAEQITNSESGAVAADFDIQLSEAQQVTGVELLDINTDAITQINLVVAEQVVSASIVDLSTLSAISTLIVEQSLNVELVPVNQSSLVSGVQAQQITVGDSVGVISDIAITTVTAEQLTVTEIVDLLDGTGLSVVIVEQGTGLLTGDVTIINTVASVSAYQATESESVRTGAVALITVMNAEQLTEVEIADILGSAMLVDPRTLRVKRTSVGYTVNRITDSFRVKFKATVH